MKYIYHIIALLSLSIAVGACMHEDRDNCPSEEGNFTLHFRYDGATRAFANDIKEVGMFLFDEYNQFVYSVVVEQEQLEVFPGVNLTVDPGDYSVVCWGNISIDIESPSGRTDNLSGISMNGEDVYYAPKQYDPDPYDSESYEIFSVNVPKVGKAEETIDFMSAYRTVSVYVKGMTDLDGSGNNRPPRVELSQIPAGYDFNFHLFSETKTFVQTSIYTDKIAGARFNTPYFRVGDDIEVIIRKQTDNSVLHSVNLQEFISAEGLVLSISDPIELMIEFIDGNVNITLPNWEGDDVKPEF